MISYLTREGNLRIVQFNVYVNGTLLNTYQADGVIISYTDRKYRYNLSAGGPVVEPTASMIVITPICSHALNTSSVVLVSRWMMIEVRSLRGPLWKAGASSSYVMTALIQRQSGQRRQSEDQTNQMPTAHLVKLSEESFMITMREKMKGN